MAEWKRVKLGEICSRICSGGTPKSTCRDYYENGEIPWLNTKEVHSNRIYGTENRITQLGLDNSSAKWVKADSVIVAMYGATAGNVAQTRIPLTTNQACCNLEVDSDKASADFVFYYLRNCYSKLLLLANGAAQQNLNAQVIREYEIPLPPLPTQRKIAAVLGALDDKIENNRKICANLEAQAQALFKSWFVDFEPFGGKMPNGWKLGKLGDLGTIVGGATPSKANKSFYTENGIHWVTPKDLSIQQTKFVSRGEIDITDAGFNAASVRMMPRGSVLFSSRAPIGYVAIAKNDICTNQGFKSVVPNPGVGSEFIYQLLCANTKLIEERASGSTFKEISTAGMRDVPVVVPSKEVLGKFSNMLSSQSEIQESKEAESRALAATRDALLPKLMSGEIDVEKVEV